LAQNFYCEMVMQNRSDDQKTQEYHTTQAGSLRHSSHIILARQFQWNLIKLTGEQQC